MDDILAVDINYTWIALKQAFSVDLIDPINLKNTRKPTTNYVYHIKADVNRNGKVDIRIEEQSIAANLYYIRNLSDIENLFINNVNLFTKII